MAIAVTDLRCERLVDPIGLDTRTPRLTWRLVAGAGETDVVQLGADVEIDGGAGLRIDGWRQQATYEVHASRQLVRWRVRAQTSVGETEWSDWAAFEVGLLEPGDWRARMITADVASQVVRFSTVVDVPDDIVAARLRATAHGIVHLAIDGVPVGDDVLAPGWTSYRNRLVARTYDVTALLPGGNDLEVVALVGPGWHSGRIGFAEAGPVYGERVGALVQLEIERAGGELLVLGTDGSWTARSTPWLLAEIYDGERVDRRLPSTEAPVEVVEGFDPAVLVAPAVPPVRRTAELRPTRLGTGVLDFEQNLVGWLRITVRGAPAGTKVTMRHAEVLDGDGALFTAPLRTARATDEYTTMGAPTEVYEPRFTFHGFRYAEITGVDPESIDVVAVVVHTDLERIGTFACSDPLLEQLHENVVWSWRGNSVSLPTDCPQRDERLGWTGDAQVFAATASGLFDCETFWESWLADLAADQLPSGSVPLVVPSCFDGHGVAGWGDAAVVVPWTTYVAHGDDAVLRRALPSMEAWVAYVHGRLDEEHRWVQDRQLGDWLDPDAPTAEPWRAKARFDLVATAYAAWSATLLERAARVVGDDALAERNEVRAATVREAWWRHYGEAAGTTQTGAALAIAFGLAPPSAREGLGAALAERVRDAGGHLATGFLGTPVLLPALADTGHLDVAYDVLLQRTMPSWLATVLAGATTIWERWDALRPDGSVALDALEGGSGGSMVSFNHYAYGSVASWLHGTVAGLRPDPDDPGYHHVLVEPRPGGGLTSASASVRSRYGTTSVAWRLDDDGRLRVDVVVPPNASATVSLPGAAPVRVGSGTHAL